MHDMCNPYGKTPFYVATTEAKTCIASLTLTLTYFGDQKTIFTAQKVWDFVGKVEISLYIQNHFGAMLIGFGNTQFVYTFLGTNQN